MSLKDKFKNFLTAGEDDFDDDFDDNEFNYDDEPENKPSSRASGGYRSEPSSYSGDRSYSGDSRNKVVNIHATTQLQVVLVKPERFEDASSIADHLNAKRTVVLNLESTSKDVTRRLVDFLSGVAYANNGQIKRVAASTFMITPFNVDIMGDMLMDELENSGIYR